MPKFSPDSLKMSKAGKGRQRQILMDKQVWRVHVATSAPDVVLASLLALLEETGTDELAAVTDAWLRRTYGTGTS